jgi:hypothetical protein
MNRVLALIALAMLGGFLGILVFTVNRTDLFVVVGLTFAIAVWDIWQTALRPRK